MAWGWIPLSILPRPGCQEDADKCGWKYWPFSAGEAGHLSPLEVTQRWTGTGGSAGGAGGRCCREAWGSQGSKGPRCCVRLLLAGPFLGLNQRLMDLWSQNTASSCHCVRSVENRREKEVLESRARAVTIPGDSSRLQAWHGESSSPVSQGIGYGSPWDRS